MGIKRGMLYIVLIGYLVGIHNGQIALWKNEDPEPFLVLPYRANMLPEEDQKALEKGIPIRSREDLIGFMEDYLS